MPTRGKLSHAEKLAAQYMALGMSITDAAQATELALPVLRRAMTHPLFEAELERCRNRAFPALAERLTDRLDRLQEPALAKMGELLQAESEPVQFQAAKDLLNRGPLAPKTLYQGQVNQQQVLGMSISLDQQALTAILSGALNMGHHAIVNTFAQLGMQAPRNVTPTPEDTDHANQD